MSFKSKYADYRTRHTPFYAFSLALPWWAIPLAGAIIGAIVGVML